MAIVNGHGGYLFFYADDIEEEAETGSTLELDMWAGDWKCDYESGTPAGFGGGTLMLPIIGMHAWQVTCPLDAANDPSDLEMFPGVVIYDAFFRRGTETDGGFQVYDRLERTTITSVQMLDNNMDAFRVMITGSGGVLTQGYVFP